MKRNKFLITIIVLGIFLFTQNVLALRPDDPYYSSQWYLPKVRADLAWDKISSSPDITIAVIDSGIQIDHPDLRQNIWANEDEIPGNGIDDDNNGFIDDDQGWDFINNSPDPRPQFSDDYSEAGLTHGTLIAGIIAGQGNNAAGISGITWNARIMPLRALDDKGQGRTGDVIRALDYAINNGAQIINLSFSSPTFSDGFKEAVMRANDAGVIIVAAAGNDQTASGGQDLSKNPLYPACYRRITNDLMIGVAATDGIDQKTNFSAFGKRCVDVSAPGIGFFGLSPYNQYFAMGAYAKYYDGFWSGTSMATAVVSGAAALAAAVNPHMSPAEIKDVVVRGSDPIDATNPSYAGNLGYGRLNILSSINWAIEKKGNYTGKFVVAPYYSAKNYYLPYWTKRLAKEVFLLNGEAELEKNFAYPFERNELGFNAINFDIDNDGYEELITGAGYGSSPWLRILDQKGRVKSEFLVERASYTGGVKVATGDVDGDGRHEIIVAFGQSINPVVKVYDNKGKLLSSFLAADRGFNGGINVAALDIDGDGRDEIVTGQGFAGDGILRVYAASGRLVKEIEVFSGDYRSGLKVLATNIDGRRNREDVEILAWPQEGADPELNIFSNTGSWLYSFSVFEGFRNGVSIAAGDINGDGYKEIAAVAGPGGTPHLRLFSYRGTLLQSKYIMDENFAGGLSIGFILLNN